MEPYAHNIDTTIQARRQFKVPDYEVRKSFQMFGTLPFIPNGDMNMARVHLRPLLGMVSFTDYMEHTWIGTFACGPETISPEISTKLQHC